MAANLGGDPLKVARGRKIGAYYVEL